MLTKRLKSILDSIPRCNVLADVGCDHGYVGIEALKRGVANNVVFADISAECLNKARRNCPTGLNECASFVCQDGLKQIRCDVAVICGMGGLEILSILNGAEKLPNAVVLQPMRNVVDVRKYVAERYTVTRDVTVYDGKFYSIIRGENLGTPTKNLTELETEFGVTNVRNAEHDFVIYLTEEQRKLRAILNGCDAAEVKRRLQLIDRALELTRRKI